MQFNILLFLNRPLKEENISRGTLVVSALDEIKY